LVEYRRWCGGVLGVQKIVWSGWWSAGDGVEGLMECRRWCGGVGGVQEIVWRGWWGEGDGVERLVECRRWCGGVWRARSVLLETRTEDAGHIRRRLQ
jgi:hypothetical protein